jgi:phosphatidylserine decarboxylase
MNNYINYSIESLIITLTLLIFGIYYKNLFLIIISLLFFLFTFLFFRGWNNIVKNPKNNVVYCPCEGKILSIKKDTNNYHIAIFLNLHNIHIQYSPIAGKLIKLKYKKGSFHPAYFFEKSNYNERMISYIDTKYGIVEFHQIAGQIARRIKVFKKEGDILNPLEPYGLIKFGSRCDLKIPVDNFVLNNKMKKDNTINIGEIIGHYKN